MYDTAPIGPPQPRYLNAALELEAAMPAEAILQALQRVERAAGRRARAEGARGIVLFSYASTVRPGQFNPGGDYLQRVQKAAWPVRAP